jgi:hydrogenase accessory protein HypB
MAAQPSLLGSSIQIQHPPAATAAADAATTTAAASLAAAAACLAWLVPQQAVDGARLYALDLTHALGGSACSLATGWRRSQHVAPSSPRQHAAALVGDCATDNDAQRLARSGAPVRQIVTEGMCHLEADMVGSHLDGWDLATLDLLVIENVGNLVCPSGFDLGEDTRVALLSVTEGEDKPLKYPQIFHSADAVVITKCDLAAAVEWDAESAYAAIRAVNPQAPIIETSSRQGRGVDSLLDHLMSSVLADDSRLTPQEA